MKETEINSQVNDDLKHIPRDAKGYPQNFLRLYYSDIRRHDISKTTKTKETTLQEAIAQVKKQFPDFQPKYDKEYFKSL